MQLRFCLISDTQIYYKVFSSPIAKELWIISLLHRREYYYNRLIILQQPRVAKSILRKYDYLGVFFIYFAI